MALMVGRQYRLRVEESGRGVDCVWLDGAVDAMIHNVTQASVEDGEIIVDTTLALLGERQLEDREMGVLELLPRPGLSIEAGWSHERAVHWVYPFRQRLLAGPCAGSANEGDVCGAYQISSSADAFPLAGMTITAQLEGEGEAIATLGELVGVPTRVYIQQTMSGRVDYGNGSSADVRVARERLVTCTPKEFE